MWHLSSGYKPSCDAQRKTTMTCHRFGGGGCAKLQVYFCVFPRKKLVLSRGQRLTKISKHESHKLLGCFAARTKVFLYGHVIS